MSPKQSYWLQNFNQAKLMSLTSLKIVTGSITYLILLLRSPLPITVSTAVSTAAAVNLGLKRMQEAIFQPEKESCMILLKKTIEKLLVMLNCQLISGFSNYIRKKLDLK